LVFLSTRLFPFESGSGLIAIHNQSGQGTQHSSTDPQRPPGLLMSDGFYGYVQERAVIVVPAAPSETAGQEVRFGRRSWTNSETAAPLGGGRGSGAASEVQSRCVSKSFVIQHFNRPTKCAILAVAGHNKLLIINDILEAGGVEPPSEKPYARKTTRLSRSLSAFADGPKERARTNRQLALVRSPGLAGNPQAAGSRPAR
jgi:hypothetical protein